MHSWITLALFLAISFPLHACDLHQLMDQQDFIQATRCIQAGEADVNQRNLAGKGPLNRLLWYPRGSSVLDAKTIPYIEALIDAGADLNYRPPEQEASAFEALLDFGLHPNAQPLVRRMLLREKDPADPNASVSMRMWPPHDERRLSPLLWTIKAGDAEMAYFLLNHGVAPDSIPAPGMGSPLAHALYYQQPAIAKLLLEKGALQSIADHSTWLLDALTAVNGQTPLIPEQFDLLMPYLKVTSKDFNAGFLTRLIRGAANWHSRKNVPLPAFRSAFKKALELGANPNGVMTSKKNSYLQILVSEGYGDLEVEEALLKVGANPNLADTDGDTPLHQIAFDRAVLRARLAELHANSPDADIHPKHFMEEKGILELINRMAGRPEYVELLKSQFTKDEIEVRLNRLEVLEKLLLKYKANPMIKNNAGQRPGDIHFVEKSSAKG